MLRREEIVAIKGFRDLYEVTVPYARFGHVEEDEVLFELNPYAALSHLSALVFHGLTGDLPKGFTVTAPPDGTSELLPLGTEPQDWDGIPPLRGVTPTTLLGRPVRWNRVKPERFFGLAVYQPRGYPVRVTTPERTLLDGLVSPELSGGIANVLQAWVLARDTIELDLLVNYTDRLGIGVVRQRVGFVLEEMGLSHPRLPQWQAQAGRGGSSKLVAADPYASDFDERWSLSLNAPVGVLRDGAG